MFHRWKFKIPSTNWNVDSLIILVVSENVFNLSVIFFISDSTVAFFFDEKKCMKEFFFFSFSEECYLNQLLMMPVVK